MHTEISCVNEPLAKNGTVLLSFKALNHGIIDFLLEPTEEFFLFKRKTMA
jgi:hypothetical protein